jgi:hypothetical protein
MGNAAVSEFFCRGHRMAAEVSLEVHYVLDRWKCMHSKLE